MMRIKQLCAMFAAAMASTGLAMAGPEWVEQNHGSGDTGSLPGASVQVVTSPTGSVSTIKGKLLGTGSAFGVDDDHEDLYLIQIDDPSTFIATTVPAFGGNSDFDSRLFLFKVDGTGLLGNDDTLVLGVVGGFSSGSTLTNMSTDGTEVVVTEPGLYLLGCTSFASSPVNDDGPLFDFESFDEVSGPDGPGGGSPITSWLYKPGKFMKKLGTGLDYEIFLSGVGSVATTRTLHLDLKPGGCPNSFNRTSNGVLPAALLGAADFDVHNINLSTVVISRADGLGGSLHPNEGPPGPHSVYEDVATPYMNNDCGCNDFGPDGFVDLSMKFKSSDMVDALQLNNVPNGSLVQLKVSGLLNDGTAFESFDCLRLVPPGSPPGMMAVTSGVAGTWINVSPPDLQLDGGGFGNFQRTYPQSTLATLTAPAVSGGRDFLGWRINGNNTLVNGTTLNYAINSSIVNIEAVYSPLAFQH